MIKVKIINCSDINYWYYDKIGHEFFVTIKITNINGIYHGDYIVAQKASENDGFCILKNDCIII